MPVLAQDLKSAVIKAAVSGHLTKSIFSFNSLDNSISDNIVPFEIKDNWKWVSFDEAFDFRGGYSFKSKNYVEKSENQVIRLGNVKNDLLITEEKQVFISDKDASLAENNRIMENDILITMTGTRGRKDYLYSVLVNKNHIQRRLYLNQRVGCFRCKNNIIPTYAIIVLKCDEILDIIFQHETGTANQGNIGLAEFKKNLLVPLPPIEEQQRIVDKLNEIMPLIDEYEKLENQLVELKKKFPDDMKAAILQAAMEGKLTEQYNFFEEKYGDMFKISGGSQPSKSEFIDSPKDGYIQLYQTRDYGDNPKPVYIPLNAAKKQTKEGDILIARYGGSLGKVFIAKNGAYNVALAKVIPINNKLHLSKFVYYYHLSTEYQNFCKSVSGSRSAQGGFNKDDINDLVYPLFSIEEQQRIVDKLDQLLPLCDALANLEQEVA